MQDYDVQNAGRVMPEDTPVRRGQGAVLNTDGAPEERSTPRNQIWSMGRNSTGRMSGARLGERRGRDRHCHCVYYPSSLIPGRLSLLLRQ